MNSDYAWILRLKIRKTNIKAQKLDSSAPVILEMIIVDFQVKDKVNKPKCFQEIFLVTDIKFEAILAMLIYYLGSKALYKGIKLSMRLYL